MRIGVGEAVEVVADQEGAVDLEVVVEGVVDEVSRLLAKSFNVSRTRDLDRRFSLYKIC